MKSMIIFAALLAFAVAVPSPKADPKPSGVAAYSLPAVPYVYSASAPAVSYAAAAPVSYSVPVSYSSYSAPIVSYSGYPYSYGYAGDHYVW